MDARTLKKEDVQKETVYCLNDDDETEVSKEDTIQGMLISIRTFAQGRLFSRVGGSLGCWAADLS